MNKITYGLVNIKISAFLNLSNETRIRSSHRFKVLEPHCKKDVSVRKTCSNFPFFPRTGRDWNQPRPDMPDVTSFAEFKNYLSSLA